MQKFRPFLILGLVFIFLGIVVIAALLITSTFVLSANNVVVAAAAASIALGLGIILWRYKVLSKARLKLPADEAIAYDLDGNQTKLVGIAKTYPKIALSEIAAKLSLSEHDAEGILISLVARGVIKGRVDPGTKEFISTMVLASDARPVEVKIVQCPYCSAALNTSVVKGASIKCKACGQLISVS